MLALINTLLAQADTTTATLTTPGPGFSYDTVPTSIQVTSDTVTQAAATVAGSNFVNNASDALNKVNWAAPSWDIFIVILFVITVFLYGISLGRDRIIVIMMSIYMSLAVVTNAPFINHIQGAFALKAACFIGIFLALFFLVSRTSLNKIFGNLAAGKLWQVLLFSILHMGLLISITFSFLPPESASGLYPLTRTIFASELGRFGWIVAPIVAMVFFTKDE